MEESGLTIRHEGDVVTLSETVPCVFTSPALLNISFGVDPPSAHGRRGYWVVGVTIDQIAFEFALYPPIDVFAADELPRVRAAVVGECERRLRRTIAALQAELSRASLQLDTNGSGQGAVEGRERALRHAGWIVAAELPAPAQPRPPQRAARAASSAYLPGRGASYLPQDRDEAPSARPRASASFGRAGYIPDRQEIALHARSAPAGPANAFPAPARPSSSEHEAASRLLRCQDLLRALRRTLTS